MIMKKLRSEPYYQKNFEGKDGPGDYLSDTKFVEFIRFYQDKMRPVFQQSTRHLFCLSCFAFVQKQNTQGLDHDSKNTVNTSKAFGKLTKPVSLQPKKILKTLKMLLEENDKKSDKKRDIDVVKGKGNAIKIRLPWINYDQCLANINKKANCSLIRQGGEEVEIIGEQKGSSKRKKRELSNERHPSRSQTTSLGKRSSPEYGTSPRKESDLLTEVSPAPTVIIEDTSTKKTISTPQCLDLSDLQNIPSSVLKKLKVSEDKLPRKKIDFDLRETPRVNMNVNQTEYNGDLSGRSFYGITPFIQKMGAQSFLVVPTSENDKKLDILENALQK